MLLLARMRQAEYLSNETIHHGSGSFLRLYGDFYCLRNNICLCLYQGFGRSLAVFQKSGIIYLQPKLFSISWPWLA